MDTLSSTDLPQFLKLIIALAVVLSLMGGLAFILKKLGLAAQIPNTRSDKRRLKIMESLPLDARRRLVIIKCDDKEHLIILGANNETVVKSDIHPVDYSSNSDQDT